MMKRTVTVNLMPYCFVVFAIFLVMKLTGYIGWSWWYVTLPLWGPSALLLGLLGGCFALYGLYITCIHFRAKYRRRQFKRLWAKHRKEAKRRDER